MLGGGVSFSKTLIPTTVAVFQTQSHGVVLVDAGFSRAELDAPAQHLDLFHRVAIRVQGSGEVSTVAQLMRLGIDPAHVSTIVATHLHSDHIGAYVDFPNAEIIAPAAEFSGARKAGKIQGFTHINQILHSGRARPIVLSSEPSHGFPRHLDLFGDGQVLLLDAKGHTRGSVAVFLSDPVSGNTVLMAGDAAYSKNEYRREEMSWLMKLVGYQKEWIRETWRRLAAFEGSFPDIPVVLAHDNHEFEHLPHL